MLASINAHNSDEFVADCPIKVTRATMVHRWDHLTFLHWDYDPDLVQAFLPPGLTVDTYHGRAWVGLVPFFMEVRPPGVGPIPWLSRFCETNVRTYTIAPDGTRGVWFLSLDASRLAAVATARATYAMPYFWSDMSLHRSATSVTYTCHRRWPSPRGVRSAVTVRPGSLMTADELDDPFHHFLTARWRLYSAHRGDRLRSALAEHEPWPLHHVEVVDVDDELVAAAGLPQPENDPIAHWSPGVEVRIGWPRAVRDGQGHRRHHTGG